MKNSNLFFILIITSFVYLNAFSQSATQYDWVVTGASPSYEDVFWNMDFDSDGNIYFIADYRDSILIADTTIYSLGGGHTIIAKLNSFGELQWILTTTGSSSEAGAIAVDENKNCHFGGWFTGTIHFGAYTITQTGAGVFNSSYYATIDSNGVFTSAVKIFNGTYDFTNAVSDISFDNNNNSYFTDRRELFIPDPFGFAITRRIKKRSPGGSIVWEKYMGVVDAKVNAIDQSGNVYLNGSYSAPITVGGTSLTPAGSSDFYLSKLNSSGTFLWTRGFGSNLSDYIGFTTSDSDGNFYFSGTFSGDSISIIDTTFYNPSPGIKDGFIVKLNSDGNIIWIKHDANYASFSSVINEDDETFHIGGLMTTPISLGGITINPVSSPDLFIASMNSNGEFNSNHLIISSSALSGTIGVYKNKIFSENSIVRCGYYKGNVTLGENIYSSPSPTNQDAFIEKLGICDPANLLYADLDNDGFGDITSSITTCSESVLGYVNNASDCDDNNAAINPLASEICNSLDDDCNGNIDEDIIIATIIPSGSTTFCKGSSVTLNANTGIGYLYQWKRNGVNISGATSSSYIVTKSGNYEVLVTVPGSCNDVSEIITVTVNPSPISTINNLDGTTDLCLDASIKLKANAGAGYTYQWYKGALPIGGAISQVYFANSTGNHKVKVTNATGCSRLSAPLAIINTCKEGNEVDIMDILIYPNPNSGLFTINANSENNTSGFAEITIQNIIGETVFYSKENFDSGNLFTTINLQEITSGIYFIVMNIDGVLYNDKITVIN